jgi:hypothetical protein
VKIENAERRDKRDAAINASDATLDGKQNANERNKKRGAHMRRVHWFVCVRNVEPTN